MIDEKLIPQIKAGAKVRVYDQQGRFEGIVLGKKHGGENGATFMVRGVVAGVGVEKIWPIKSPVIKKIEIMSSPKQPSRAKIYYTRELSKKQMRRKIGVSLK